MVSCRIAKFRVDRELDKQIRSATKALHFKNESDTLRHYVKNGISKDMKKKLLNV